MYNSWPGKGYMDLIMPGGEYHAGIFLFRKIAANTDLYKLF